MISENPPIRKLGYLHNEVEFTPFDENNFLFFPLTYSEEHERIVSTLFNNNNCLIQGGPGTGKTQVLVNMFINALAKNKNVLYTVKNKQALLAFEELLPTYLKDYVLILSEDTVFDDVRLRVKKYVDNVTSLLDLSEGNAHFKNNEYLSLKDVFNEINKKLVDINLQIKNLLELNQQVVLLNGESYNFQMAYDFLGTKKNIPLMNYKFEDKDYDALSKMDWKEFVNHLNILSQNDLKYYEMKETMLTHTFMSYPNHLMSSFSDLLAKQKKIKLSLEGSLRELNKRDIYPQVVSKFEDLKSSLTKYNILMDEKMKANFLKFFSRRKSLNLIEESLAFLTESMPNVIEAFSWKTEFPDNSKLQELDYFKELESLADGGSLDGVMSKLTKKKQKDFFDAVLFNGATVKDTETWKKIHDKIVLQRKVRSHVNKWNEHANTFGFSIIEENQPIDVAFYNVKKNVDVFYLLAGSYIQIEQLILPYMDLSGTVFENVTVLQTYMNTLQEKEVINTRIQVLKAELNMFIQSSFLIPENVGIAQEALKNEEYDNLVTILNKEIKQENIYHPIKDSYVYIYKLLNEYLSSGDSGALGFLKLFLESGYTLKLDPTDVIVSVKKTILNQFIKNLNSATILDSLMEDKGLYTRKLKDITNKMIENRVQSVCIDRMSKKENNAILDTIQSLYLKFESERENSSICTTILSLIKEIIQFLPGVAMTNGKVMEFFPGNNNVIRLLLVDDASQEGFEYLPLLLKGEKVLIAGDEKMFTPSQRYESESFERLKIKNLSTVPTFLNKMVTPSASLFDIAMSVLYQNKVILSENFRTNTDILSFVNNRYYQGELIGLKSPSVNQKSSLVDVLIHDSNVENGVNKKEADFIIKEILTLTEDKKFNKTLGVISFAGKEQLSFIDKQLKELLSPDILLKHKILIGTPNDFQGRERDVIFISGVQMLEGGVNHQDSLKLSVSRVRDVLYFVHSLKVEDVSSDESLKCFFDFFQPKELKQEFNNIQLIEQCKTIVEKDLMAYLLGREFIIRPNVKYGKFVIDLVVFGKSSNLVIEVDGDTKELDYSWKKSLKRQVELENVGWNFYRVLCSQFYFNKSFVFESLMKKLAMLDIQGFVEGQEPEIDKTVVSKVEY